MLLTVDFEVETPIYRQIRDQIVIGIASGKLQKGEALPSVRQLAADLAVNVQTIQKTYGMLKEQGYITLHKRKGATIATPPQADAAFNESLSAELTGLAAEARCRKLSEAAFLTLCKRSYLALAKGGN